MHIFCLRRLYSRKNKNKTIHVCDCKPQFGALLVHVRKDDDDADLEQNQIHSRVEEENRTECTNTYV